MPALSGDVTTLVNDLGAAATALTARDWVTALHAHLAVVNDYQTVLAEFKALGGG